MENITIETDLKEFTWTHRANKGEPKGCQNPYEANNRHYEWAPKRHKDID